MAEQFVTCQVEENTAIVVINKPPVNALGAAVMQELSDVFDRLEQDPQVKAVIITANGPIFIAGADIKEIAAIESPQKAKEVVLKGQAVLNRIENFKVPVIAAINGLCLGGGNELAMACHIRVVSDRTRIAQPEIALGIIPGFGGTQRLTRIVGPAKAAELILTADVLTAKDALEIGLVNKVVPERAVLKEAKGIAKKITSKGRKAIELVMQAIRQGREKPLSEGLALEAELFAKVCATADMREGVKAFIEKRQPTFTDS